MADPFDKQARTWGMQPEDAFDITPSDGTPLATAVRGLMVAVAGDVSVITFQGTTVTLPALEPGIQYAIRCTHIRSTNTVATGIVGLV